MKEIYYVYNNEAIATCVLLSIINKVEKIDIARCCLLLPFFLDDKMVSFLKNNFSQDQSLENMVNGQQGLFAAFNKKYLSLLPVMINSIMILKKSELIRIENKIVSMHQLDITHLDLGNRFSKIRAVMPSFLELTNNYPTEQLYKLLRVQL
ncbi:three component ABC system middle component [Chryseobacterium indologenes]|uniref:three component ABC system middle component n=1 Tax=Chryseobacterium indologenes TaxID=253 RepID=UPI00054D975E